MEEGPSALYHGGGADISWVVFMVYRGGRELFNGAQCGRMQCSWVYTSVAIDTNALLLFKLKVSSSRFVCPCSTYIILKRAACWYLAMVTQACLQ